MDTMVKVQYSTIEWCDALLLILITVCVKCFIPVASTTAVSQILKYLLINEYDYLFM